MSHLSEPVVVARNLRKAFDDVVAVDDLSLEVAAGEVVGLLGPNGAGKTTTIRMLTTQLPIESGSAEVASFDIATDGDAVRRSIGLAGQAAAVDDKLTARENLDLFARLYHLPRAERKARVEELIAKFRLDDFADQPAGTLSGRPTPPAGHSRCADHLTSRHLPGRANDGPRPAQPGRRSGRKSAAWPATEPPSSSPRSISTKPTNWPTASSSSTRARWSPKAPRPTSRASWSRDVLLVTLADPDQLATAKSAAGSADVHASDATTLHISVASTEESLAILEAMRTAGVTPRGLQPEEADARRRLPGPYRCLLRGPQ